MTSRSADPGDRRRPAGVRPGPRPVRLRGRRVRSTPVDPLPCRGRATPPSAPAGGTDDYHCTLVNPHVTRNSFIVKAQFYPNSIEVHHAILFLIPRTWRPRPWPTTRMARGGRASASRPCPAPPRSTRSPTPRGSPPGPRGTAPMSSRPAPGMAARRQPGRRAGPLQPAPGRQAGAGGCSSPPCRPPPVSSASSLDLPAGAARHPVPGRVSPVRSATDRPRWPTSPPASAVGRDLRQHHRAGLRPQPGRPAGRRHDVVHLAHRRRRDHRPAGRPHAPHGSFAAIVLDPGTPSSRSYWTSRTTTSTTRSRTRWPIR